MTPELCRGARAVLGWSQLDLAERTKLGRQTINSYEKGHGVMTAGNKLLIAMVFREAGIEFDGGEKPGLRVTRPGLLTVEE